MKISMCILSHMNRFESFPIVKAFHQSLSAISGYSEKKFVVGVSGGIDSMSLLYLLHRCDIDCVVAHCNYQLRGEDSEKDRELVEQVASMWNFECITAVFDPDEGDAENTQLWARRLRYRMFRDIQKECGADFILTAHHRNDQVETILQKILRGSGLGAWSGMERMEAGLVRPLLDCSKEMIIEFADEMKIPYRDDLSNESTYYSRNLIRKELAPRMDRLFPGWKENVLKIPARAREFELMAESLLNWVETETAALIRSKLLELDSELWPVIIHRFIGKYLPDYSLSAGELKQVKELNKLQTGAQVQFGEEKAIMRDRDYFRLISVKPEPAEVTVLEIKDLPAEVGGGRIYLSTRSWDRNFKEGKLFLDPDKLTWPLTVRTWNDGGRMQPLGMEGHKLISDILTDKKISSSKKNKTFLVESFDGIIHAVIFPHVTEKQQVGLISEKGKCSSETKQVLQIDITY